MRHVLVENRNSGLEYGVLRDFEDEIVRVTGAERVRLPGPKSTSFAGRRQQHCTRWSFLRRLRPRGAFPSSGDVLWNVLMSPCDYELDLFDGWTTAFSTRILYVFDNFDCHVRGLDAIVRAADWTHLVTSFVEAVPDLERATGRRWHVVPQGVKPSRFTPSPLEKRLITFSAYGRRHPKVHAAVRNFCAAHGHYYDFTTFRPASGHVEPEDAYAQYAWHLSHSLFTISGPVGVTNPDRAGRYDPLTCRWFEAAASGTPVIGRIPSPAYFRETLGFDDVVALSEAADADAVADALDQAIANAAEHHAAAAERRSRLLPAWTWERRVRSILELL